MALGQPLLYLSPMGKGQSPAAAAQEGSMLPTAFHWLLQGTCWPLETDACHWSWSCSVSSIIKTLFHSVLDSVVWQCCVFLGISDTKIQWAKILGCLLLVTGNRCHCSSLKINNVTNYGRKGKGKGGGEKRAPRCCCHRAVEKRWTKKYHPTDDRQPSAQDWTKTLRCRMERRMQVWKLFRSWIRWTWSYIE